MRFISKKNIHPYLLIFLVLLVSYAPVISFLFSIKNDLYSQYFAPRFFLSESLQAGYVPWWNPYLNFGFPFHADMNSGFWNPITWLFGLMTGYNAYTIIIELFCYLLLAGIGMFEASKSIGHSKKTALVLGIVYACSGYMTGHLQFLSWIAGAAFLPFVFLTYNKFVDSFSLKNLAGLLLSLYLFLSSAHPGFSITLVYFLLFLFIHHLYFKKNDSDFLKKLRRVAASHSILLAVFLLLCAGLLLSYYQLAPYFTRGEKVTIEQSVFGHFEIPCLLSLCFPLITISEDNFFHTDITNRNAYFGIFLLIFFLYFVFKYKKNSRQWLLLFSALFFLIISLGGWLKEITHRLLPGEAYIRGTTVHLVFFIFPALLLSGDALNDFFEGKKLQIKSWLSIAKWIVSFLVLFFLAGMIISKNSILFAGLIDLSFTREHLKILLSRITFWDAGLIQSLVLFFILYGAAYFGRKRHFAALIIIDVVINSLLFMPRSSLGKTSVAGIQAIIDRSPAKIPLPILHPVSENAALPDSLEKIVGSWSMYNKEPGTTSFAPYPCVLKSTGRFFSSQGRNTFFRHPFIYIEPGNQLKKDPAFVSSLHLLEFTPNEVELEYEVSDSAILNFSMNYYPGWKSMIDGKPDSLEKANISFMKTAAPKGKHWVVLKYFPGEIVISSVISLITLITVIFIWLYYKLFLPLKPIIYNGTKENIP